MVTTIKQRVTVQAGGHVALQSAELREGESADVLVMVDRPGTQTTTADQRMGALNQLRQTLKLSAAAAQSWEAEVSAERAASRLPSAEK